MEKIGHLYLRCTAKIGTSKLVGADITNDARLSRGKAQVQTPSYPGISSSVVAINTILKGQDVGIRWASGW